MEIQEYLGGKYILYNEILEFIRNENEYSKNHNDIFNDKKLQENSDELRELLYLLAKISKNHFRYPNFFDKIEQILAYFEVSIKHNFSTQEIFDIFRKCKRILLYLLEKQFIVPDSYVIKYIIDQNQNYKFYFYKFISSYLDSEHKKSIEEEFSRIDNGILNDFESKCKIGENESYICYLIRNDLIKDFIIYVNKKNLSLSSTINTSFYETNSFLLNKTPTLIEYAAFFGSIQIFNYLQINNVELNSSLWLYAIHGCNAEIIHFLEENKIQPSDKSYKKILIEAIKCHHNDIAKYIKDNLFFDKYDGKNCSRKYQ